MLGLAQVEAGERSGRPVKTLVMADPGRGVARRNVLAPPGFPAGWWPAKVATGTATDVGRGGGCPRIWWWVGPGVGSWCAGRRGAGRGGVLGLVEAGVDGGWEAQPKQSLQEIGRWR